MNMLAYCSISQGDGWAHITGLSDEFAMDKDNPRVEVELHET